MNEYGNVSVMDILEDYSCSPEYTIQFEFQRFLTILESDDGECNIVYNCSNNYKNFTIDITEEVDLSDFEDLYVLCTNDKGTFYSAVEIDEEYSYFGKISSFLKHLDEYDLKYLIEDCDYDIDDKNEIIKLTYVMMGEKN